jgi:hypothetical protein
MLRKSSGGAVGTRLNTFCVARADLEEGRSPIGQPNFKSDGWKGGDPMCEHVAGGFGDKLLCDLL